MPEERGSGAIIWLVEPETPGITDRMDKSEAKPFIPNVVPVGIPPVIWASIKTPFKSIFLSSTSACNLAEAIILPP